MAKKDSKNANLVGKQFDDYKLIEAFAIGGMSQIYKGEDINLGRIAAVKVLTPDLLEKDSTLVERFQREARAVARLEHDNIITIYKYGEQDEHYYLVMQLIQGEDLADVLNALQHKGQLMSPKRMLDILGQVASALDYAHEANIIHRDIKPSNILIDKTDRAILTDFGLVLRNDNLDQTMGTAFGTPRYISPEQALASERAVPQSDIYSLAVIVYEILTGEMIYKADTAMGFALSHISEPPPPPRIANPDIPRAVEREILKALDKIPEKRHDTAMQFIEALRDSYGEESLKDDIKPPVEFGTSTPVMAPIGLRDDSKVKATAQEVDTWTLSRDDATPVVTVGDKPKPIIEDKPTIPETPIDSQPKPKEAVKVESKGKKRKRGVSFLYVIFSILVIGGVALAGLAYNNLNTDDTQTTTTDGDNTDQVIVVITEEVSEVTPTEEVLTIPEGGEEIIAYYDFDAIVFYNNGDNTIIVDNLTITGPNEIEFLLRPAFGSTLIPPGECAFARDDQANSNEPDEANCQELVQQMTLDNSAVFWRGNEETEEFTFTVQWNELDIITCDTVERNDSNSCTFLWPDLEETVED